MAVNRASNHSERRLARVERPPTSNNESCCLKYLVTRIESQSPISNRVACRPRSILPRWHRHYSRINSLLLSTPLIQAPSHCLSHMHRLLVVSIVSLLVRVCPLAAVILTCLLPAVLLSCLCIHVVVLVGDVSLLIPTRAHSHS